MPHARQDLRHHARRRRARRGARRRRRDRPRVLAGHAARRRRRAGARDRARAAAVRDRWSGCSSIPTRDARARGRWPRVPLDLLQFHGAETPEFCRSFGRPYLKAVAVKRRGRFARIRGPIRRRRRVAVRCAAGRAAARRHGPHVRLVAAFAAVRAKLPRRWCCPAARTPRMSARRYARCGRGPWTCRAASKRGADGRPRRASRMPARIAAFIEEVRNADD